MHCRGGEFGDQQVKTTACCDVNTSSGITVSSPWHPWDTCNWSVAFMASAGPTDKKCPSMMLSAFHEMRVWIYDIRQQTTPESYTGETESFHVSILNNLPHITYVYTSPNHIINKTHWLTHWLTVHDSSLQTTALLFLFYQRKTLIVCLQMRCAAFWEIC